ncbi:MAG: DUF1566 domain-containing protein [Gammaproteobacteria bacterium]|nr:DUF1566 domain-containing protein [Gammaproteobacteria bacterium]MDH5802759.1 DUF1566 domain-containing protein [Gammaproteobacteria bacterium]
MLSAMLTKKFFIFIAAFSLQTMVQTVNSWPYECEGNIPEEERFYWDDDGTVTDLVSGLTWMRCALGQSWNGSTCTGESIAMPWDMALKKTHELNSIGGFASYRDWRLPKLPELASIVNNNCKYPRIDLSLFPNTASVVFWSTDRKQGTKAIYILDFGRAGVGITEPSESNHVRLVRGRD